MARIVSFVCNWVAQAVGDFIDLLAIDQISDRLAELISIDHHVKSMIHNKNAPTKVRVPGI